jgi:hypothetical protein
MDLLSLKKGPQNYSTVGYSYEVLRNSRVLKFLSATAIVFIIVQFLILMISQHINTLLSYLMDQLVTAQTFMTRLTDDFRQDILDGKLGLKNLQKKIAYDNLHFNDEIMDLTTELLRKR